MWQGACHAGRMQGTMPCMEAGCGGRFAGGAVCGTLPRSRPSMGAFCRGSPCMRVAELPLLRMCLSSVLALAD